MQKKIKHFQNVGYFHTFAWFIMMKCMEILIFVYLTCKLFHPLGTEDLPTKYTNGPKDFCTIFFYSMAWIVVHAIIQEYVWDVSKSLP